MTEADEDTVCTHVNNGIKQAVVAANNKHRDSHQKPLGVNALPSMRGGDDCYVGSHWSDVVCNPGNIEFIISQSVEGSTRAWLQASKLHVCQCWPEGEAPVSAIKKCGLKGFFPRTKLA